MSHDPGHLTIKDLAAIQSALWNTRTKWYNIGIQLGECHETLNTIRIKHSDNPDECLTDLLARWLRNSDKQPTWKSIVKALLSVPVDETQLARKIERNKLVTENVSSSDTESAAIVADGESGTHRHSIDKNPLSCSTEQGVHMVSYRNIAEFRGLTDTQKEELEQRLTMDTEDIKLKFCFLCNKFFNSLDAQNLPPQRLVRHLKGIKALKVVKSSTIVIPHELDKIKTMIEDYSSFFDFRLVEYMIELNGLKEDKDQLVKYKKDFE